MRDFICAYFGKGSNGEDWTITARGFSSARQAEKHGLYMMPVPGCFGFAVIEEGKSSWDVNWDRSMLSGKETVSLDNLGNFAISF
jgi:hypothetical protein